MREPSKHQLNYRAISNRLLGLALSCSVGSIGRKTYLALANGADSVGSKAERPESPAVMRAYVKWASYVNPSGYLG